MLKAPEYTITDVEPEAAFHGPKPPEFEPLPDGAPHLTYCIVLSSPESR